MIALRPYQQRAVDEARDALRAGKRRILICAPTGSGKTVIASHLLQSCVQKGRRATFVVDRVNLIEQTSAMLDGYKIAHGVIQASHVRRQMYQRVQVCSVQTLQRRQWPISDLDIFDEAHVLHKTHKKRLQQGDSIVIGLTATPFTRGLGQWFDAVVNVTTTRELIAQKWLAPYRIYSCAQPDMAGVAVKSSGEWAEKEASARALQVVGDVVAEYQLHGQGRKFICSAVDVAHVQELQRRFLAAGINAQAYTYKEDEAGRADVVAEFRQPDSNIRGLITVTAASRGFDVPDIGCVIMARPLRKSLAEHIQLFGRGLRMAQGKSDCLVLDHSGNCARFWHECEAFFDTGAKALDDGKGKKPKKAQPPKEREAVKCPNCRALHMAQPHCPQCGHEYPKKAAVEHVAGSLKKLLARYGAGARLGHAPARQAITQDLWPQVCGYATERKGDDAQGARKMALALFKEMAGVWPAASFEDTVAVAPSKEVRARIRSLQIRYAHAIRGKTARRFDARGNYRAAEAAQ